jgi:lipoyl-dependent peroxiredoxin
MPVRTGDAEWNGTLQDGKGTVRLGSGAFEGDYSFGTRFGEDPGTNPEELIAAAHAGCYSMALSAGLGSAGYAPESIRTQAKVHIDPRDAGGFAITRIELATEAHVHSIGDEQFQQIAEDSKTSCPVSGALAAVPIQLTATLIS